MGKKLGSAKTKKQIDLTVQTIRTYKNHWVFRTI
jgi:hypothetical protein